MNVTAATMIDAWVAHHGKPIPWAKAVEILTIVDRLPAEERDRLLALDETAPPVPERQMSLPLISTPVDDGLFGPPPMQPVTPEEQQMLDAIAVETDLSKFPAIVTRSYDGKIYDNDGNPLTRIQRALLRRMWQLQGR